MNFYLKNCLVIENPTKEMKEWCYKRLSFFNPEYIKKEKAGRWTGNTPRMLYLYETIGNRLVLPFGVFKEVYNKFKSDFQDRKLFIKPIRGREYKSDIKPYDYQEKAIEAAMTAKNGVLVAPCGSGKTQIGLEVVNRIGGKTLWLTHTVDLLNQSMQRALSNFNLPKSEYGTITAGKVNVGNTMTFATVQTMANIDLSKLRDEFDCIIVDECHHCVGSPTKMQMFYKVLSKLSARYKIGLTATPFRADGLHEEMYAILGEKIYEVPKSEVKSKTCPVEVNFYHTEYSPDLDVVLAGDGTLIYSALINDLCNNEKRNNLISQIISETQGATIILSDRLDHLRQLKKIIDLSGNKKTAFISASNTKKDKIERKEAIKKLNDGEIDVLFASYALAKEGLDVPNLRYVVFASPQKDKTTVIQASGRVERKAEGKDKGVIIDFIDNFGALYGYQRKRLSYYKKLGYTIL